MTGQDEILSWWLRFDIGIQPHILSFIFNYNFGSFFDNFSQCSVQNKTAFPQFNIVQPSYRMEISLILPPACMMNSYLYLQLQEEFLDRYFCIHFANTVLRRLLYLFSIFLDHFPRKYLIFLVWVLRL